MATAAFEEIVADFEFLEDWEDRYRYVIDQGKTMAPLPDALKVPATKVDGCASQVWLHPQIENGVFSFDGESDAMIVRGLIAVLRRCTMACPWQRCPASTQAASCRGWVCTITCRRNARTGCAR